jgi:hypothetical protein
VQFSTPMRLILCAHLTTRPILKEGEDKYFTTGKTPERLCRLSK